MAKSATEVTLQLKDGRLIGDTACNADKSNCAGGDGSNQGTGNECTQQSPVGTQMCQVTLDLASCPPAEQAPVIEVAPECAAATDCSERETGACGEWACNSGVCEQVRGLARGARRARASPSGAPAAAAPPHASPRTRAAPLPHPPCDRRRRP